MSIDAGGGGIISTESSSIEQMASALSTAGGNIQRQTLSTIDERSTILANRNARNVFSRVQRDHGLFSNAISNSATMITTIANAFEDVDSNALSGIDRYQ